MNTADHQKLTLDELTNRYIAWLGRVLPEDYGRLLVPTVRELAATGQPVEPRRLAELAGMPLQRTLALLHEAPTEWDDSGERVAGLGLTLNRTPHRYQTHGRTVWAWCAVDTLELPVVLGAPARVQSACAATGDPITIEVSPTGVDHLEPASAVVSGLTPDTDLASIRELACRQSNFYRSAEVAASWLAEDPAQRQLLPVADAFEVSRRLVSEVWRWEPPS